jgi:tripartite-type tricarboxylate transporter receptor subunit TctC
MKAFGIALQERSALSPEIPTLAEAGYKGQNWDSFYGLVAPSKTPPAILQRIAAGVNSALARPEIKDKMLSVGFTPVGNSPEEFGRFLQTTAAIYAKIIKENDIKPPQ